MFCYHCQEAKKNRVCDQTGICGKSSDLSSLQDLLVFSLKGLAFYAVQARQCGMVDEKTDQFTVRALYATVTNVNFDPSDFVWMIKEAVQRRNRLRRSIASENPQHDIPADSLPEAAQWQYDNATEREFIEKGASICFQVPPEEIADSVALQETLLYGVKGLSALLSHAAALDAAIDPNFHTFIQEALLFGLQGEVTEDDALARVLACGEQGLAAMALLEQANTGRFGHPTPTRVYLDVWDKPAILVSGNDLRDLEELLEQTDGTGVDVYTHGEMIAAHAYPVLRKHPHLVGNYGNTWFEQRIDFAKFNGPILVTTNSIQQQKATYKDRIFTTGMVGWPGIPHIQDRKPGQQKNFQALIEMARQCQPPTLLEEGSLSIGYARNTLSEMLDRIVAALQSGAVKRLIVLAGGDGRHKERRYYTQLAEALPADTIILTAGDAKFRFLKLDLGEIDGIPRILDAGQSHDIHSLIVFLQQAMGVDHINDLPVSFDLAWYEQKTLIALLALLSLDIKNIRFGPTLPPFFTENIKNLLAKKFALKGIDNPEADVAAMLAGS